MPLNREGKDVQYTTNEEIKDLMESGETDYCLEFIGFVVQVHGRSIVLVNNKYTELFKCVISNGTQRITLLIWDSEMIKTLSENLVADRILHLDGCQGQVVLKKKYHNDNDILNYEIIIQANTKVKFIGTHVHAQPEVAPIPTIQFLDIVEAVGEIKVEAYIKTVVSSACGRHGKLGFGVGTITDGVHKIPIHVTEFNANVSQHLTKGSAVLVRGVISRTGPLLLICQNIDYVELLMDKDSMSEEQVARANKSLKRKLNYGEFPESKRGSSISY